MAWSTCTRPFKNREKKTLAIFDQDSFSVKKKKVEDPLSNQCMVPKFPPTLENRTNKYNK